jgi:ATP-dependent Lon protease
MMQTELIEQIIHLPISERVEIIERISRNVREDLGKKQKEFSIEERKKAIDRLRGIAAVKGKTPPTDEEIKEDYLDYLSEKYK